MSQVCTVSTALIIGKVMSTIFFSLFVKMHKRTANKSRIGKSSHVSLYIAVPSGVFVFVVIRKNYVNVFIVTKGHILNI